MSDENTNLSIDDSSAGLDPADSNVVVDLNLCPVQAHKTGRPSVLDALNLTVEQIVSCYENSRSEVEAAKKLGISKRTLMKYLKMSAVPPDRSNARRIRGISYRPSIVYDWIRAQKGFIPRSVAAISRLSGIKEVTIRKFLARRKHAAEVHIASYGTLMSMPSLQLATVHGQRFTMRQVAQLETKVDNYDLSVEIRAVLRSGVSVLCRLSFAEYCRLFDSLYAQNAELPQV